MPKVKIEVVVVDNRVATANEAIIRKACTGKIGDGKIFVSDLRDVIRIRTNERGAPAI
jgi:nitrogen regulatory protein PII